MTKKEFIFFLLDEKKNNNLIDNVLDHLRRCKEYSEAVKTNNEFILEYYDKEKYCFPDDIELSPEEINEIIRLIYNLKSDYWQDVKSDIAKEIFEHVSDKSKIEYFRSNGFLEMTREDRETENLTKSVFNTIPDEKQDKVLERINEKT